jgi:hypothetical protein
MTYIINNENFTLFVIKLANGWNRSQSYSSECVSSSSIARANALNYLFVEFIDRVNRAGYCPVATVEPILEKYEMYVNGSCPHLKQAIDEDFHINLSDFQQAVDFCEFAYNEAINNESEISQNV